MPDLPEPTIRPTRYTVSVLPEDHVDASSFTLWVERDRYGWGVNDGRSSLGADGQWDRGGVSVYGRDDAWIATHRFDEQTALRLAREAAPHVTVNGHTVAEALARHQESTP
jgi:hypothetical protein